jgi:hypothetical protein
MGSTDAAADRLEDLLRCLLHPAARVCPERGIRPGLLGEVPAAYAG